MLIEKIKADVTQAMRDKDVVRKDILRLAVGEAQSQSSRTGKPASDDDMEKVMRKMLVGIRLCIAEGGVAGRLPHDGDEYKKLMRQHDVLTAYLPQTMSLDEIRGTIVSSPEIESSLLTSKSEGQAVGIVMKALKGLGKVASGEDVKQIVTELRGLGG